MDIFTGIWMGCCSNFETMAMTGIIAFGSGWVVNLWWQARQGLRSRSRR